MEIFEANNRATGNHVGNNQIWREWCSLSCLTDRFPKQFQYGFHIAPLKLTCLDAFPNSLAIGTNVGLVYIAHLPSFNLMRLKCDNVNFPISCISAVGSVDDMIAAGCENGSINIFQLPSLPSDSEVFQKYGHPEVYVNKKSPKRFTVNIHNCSLTSLKWSKNGLRLFSGDMNGHIGVIEVDYENCQCTGKLILKVDSSVVQLSYSHQLLAISYEERCIIYSFKEQQTVTVGKKTRIPPGKFGCAFASSVDNYKDILYCARPGQKIWSAASDGNVLFSYIHKKSPEHSVISLLNSNGSSDKSQITCDSDGSSKASFGLLIHIKDSILASYSKDYFIILDVNFQKVLGYTEAFEKICDATFFDNNIFILVNNKDIVCLSQDDPKFGDKICNDSAQSLQENLYFNSLSEITSKVIIPKKQFVEGIAKLSESVVSKFSEITSPNVISGSKRMPEMEFSHVMVSASMEVMPDSQPTFPGSGFMPKKEVLLPSNFEEQVSSTQILPNDWTVNSSDQLVTYHHSKKKPKKKFVTEITKLKEVTDDDENNCDCIIDDEAKVRGNSLNSDSTKFDSMSDVASSSFDLKKNIEEKEKVLASVLNLDCLKMDHVENDSQETDKYNDVGDLCSDLSIYKENSPSYRPEDSILDNINNHLFDSTELLSNDDSLSSTASVYKMDSHNYMKNLSYGPPSGSSILNSSVEDSSSIRCCHNSSKSDEEYVHDNAKPLSHLNSQQAFQSTSLPEELPCGWFKFNLPECTTAFGSNKSIVCFTDNCYLYFTQSLADNICNGWKKRKLPVVIQHFYHCCEEQIILLQTSDGLFKVEELFSMEPLKFSYVEDHVCCASYDDSGLWILFLDGTLTARSFLKEDGKLQTLEISCPESPLISIVSYGRVIWGLHGNGALSYRIGINCNSPSGFAWGFIPTTCSVKNIHLSNYGIGWLVNSLRQIYFKVMIDDSHPQGTDEQWWQVEQSESMTLNEDFLINSTESHLWICNRGTNQAYAHSLSFLSGHCWNKILGDKMEMLIAEGMFKSYGVLLSTNFEGKLYAFNAATNSLTLIEIPNNEELACVSSRPESIWILTEKGNIFIRTEISSNSPLGIKWVPLDLEEIADIHLVHLSLGAEVVWAVDDLGKVYMRQGPLNPPSRYGLGPGWLHVESTEFPIGVVFSKMFVGNNLNMVWGIDSCSRIHVREAIFQEISTGISWVFVAGLLAKSITISEDRVFVLTIFNEVYERIGVSSTNYIGDSWRKIPSPPNDLTVITVSVDNILWGLCSEGQTWKHTHQVFIDGSPVSTADSDGVGEHELYAEGWEVV